MEDQKQLSINNGQQNEGNEGNPLPSLALEKICRMLAVTERIRLGRVDHFWNRAVRENGWKGEKKLDYDVVFGGAERVNRDAFTQESLVGLIKSMGANLIELDLPSFSKLGKILKRSDFDPRFDERLPITAGIYGLLPVLPKLSKINVVGMNLSEAIPILPLTLSEIHTNGPFDEATLSALATKCPNLKGLDFGCAGAFEEGVSVPVPRMNNFLIKYPSLKKLRLDRTFFTEDSGTLTSIGALKELEEFELSNGVEDNEGHPLDDSAFVAMVEGCKRLRRLDLYIYDIPLSVESFSQLTKLPNLVELILTFGHPDIDAIVKAVSKCPNLKKLDISASRKFLTDDSIVFLLKHCKSLISLDVCNCSQITEKSLEAVLTAVINRHGNPPKTLPEGPSDAGIFHFQCKYTKIQPKKASNMIGDNPWLKVELINVIDVYEYLSGEKRQINDEEELSSADELDEEEHSSADELDEEELSSLENLDEE